MAVSSTIPHHAVPSHGRPGIRCEARQGGAVPRDLRALTSSPRRDGNTSVGRDGELERLTFFADAVFAIALTLLALDLRPPDVVGEHGHDLLISLITIWPKLLSFVTSFTVVALYWTAHHRISRFIHRSDERLVWLTILLLGGITFIPFPAAVLGEHLRDPIAEEFYFGTLFLNNLVLAAIWWYASWNHHLVAQNLSLQVIRHYRRIALAPVLAFGVLLALIPLGLVRFVEPLFFGYLAALAVVVLALCDWREPC